MLFWLCTWHAEDPRPDPWLLDSRTWDSDERYIFPGLGELLRVLHSLISKSVLIKHRLDITKARNTGKQQCCRNVHSTQMASARIFILCNRTWQLAVFHRGTLPSNTISTNIISVPQAASFYEAEATQVLCTLYTTSRSCVGEGPFYFSL